MTIPMLSAGHPYRFLCILLALVIATAPSVSLFAQTNAAQQAVRERVDQFGPYSSGPSEPTDSASAERAALMSDPSVPKIDTTFVSPGASAVLVIRPAQILTAPNAELLPKEVAAAAGINYLGFDPAEVEEIVAFVDMTNPIAPSYGVTIKFNNPFRASAIPAERRAHAQLAEFAGKKYLQSSVPPLYSLFGPNNKTLILAPDPTLRQLVESIDQPKSGPILDRVQNAPAGSDLYLAIDVASLRPFIQMGMAQAQAHVPAESKQLLDAPNLIAAAELTFNFSNDGPISFVLHANDEAAAIQLETVMAEARSKYEAQSLATAGDSPIQQAVSQYTQRLSQPFVPQRSGASLTCFYIDGQNPALKQLISSLVVGAFAIGVPAIPAAVQAAQKQQAQPPTDPGAPPEPAPPVPIEQDPTREPS